MAAELEDGRLVADDEDARDEAVAAIQDATPAVIDEGEERAVLVDADDVDVDTHVVETEDGEDDEQYHVEADLVRAEGDVYPKDGAVVALTDDAREYVVEALSGVTPKSLGADKADTTELFDEVSAESDGDHFAVRLSAADGVDIGTDLDPDREVLEYTHSELPDIADEADAYSLIPGRFYLNLEGREPRGSVPQEEYEQVRSELKAELEEMEGPNGEPVADRVVTKEDAFRGDHDDIAPDLTIVPNHGFDLKAGFKGRKNPFVEFAARNGMHSFDNATLLIDDEEARVSDVDLFDIAPTILDLMGVDYERGEFDGTSLV
ncbi:alkaline phosphatase family protein [Halosimplex litoreum]|uniref:Alkaline phosphatase family protein n=1 Tax=Halosimplex litoreum TaxID=1198301 RepID=A0A7U3WBK9_9EURY|nr:alkaline phosphatase family protein [Halosimplex litoreum]